MSKKASDTSLAIHLAILVVVRARPCYEAGDVETCLLYKASLNDEEVFPVIHDQLKKDPTESVRKRHKYEMLAEKREMRGIPEPTHTWDDETEDVVDREDHITQYLAEFLVNTDSEITSLEASDVEETRDNSRSNGKDDGYFSFLTGAERDLEVEGAWSHPAKTVIDEGEFVN